MGQTEPQPQTGDSKKAPGDLGLVQDFINSLDLRPRCEELGSIASLKGWLVEHGLLAKSERLSDSDLRHALEVREALRNLSATNTGDKPSPASIQALSRAARSAQLLVQFEPGGRATLTPVAGGIDHALGRLLAITAHAMLDGSWERLKACDDETCRWAFYDYSKNRSRNWCSMSSCGNRVKARRFRNRQRA